MLQLTADRSQKCTLSFLTIHPPASADSAELLLTMLTSLLAICTHMTVSWSSFRTKSNGRRRRKKLRGRSRLSERATSNRTARVRCRRILISCTTTPLSRCAFDPISPLSLNVRFGKKIGQLSKFSS